MLQICCILDGVSDLHGICRLIRNFGICEKNSIVNRLGAAFRAGVLAGIGVASAEDFKAGSPLGTTNEAGTAMPINDNVDVFGSFGFAGRCTFDPGRNLVLAMNAGVSQKQQENHGYVSPINPDGAVHTTQWIDATRDGLTLNHAFGNAVRNSTIFVGGAPLAVPNGVAIDPDGNVVVNIANNELLTIDRDGDQVRTERVAEGGNASIVILDDGKKYVSSVGFEACHGFGQVRPPRWWPAASRAQPRCAMPRRSINS